MQKVITILAMSMSTWSSLKKKKTGLAVSLVRALRVLLFFCGSMLFVVRCLFVDTHLLFNDWCSQALLEPQIQQNDWCAVDFFPSHIFSRMNMARGPPLHSFSGEQFTIENSELL